MIANGVVWSLLYQVGIGIVYIFISTINYEASSGEFIQWDKIWDVLHVAGMGFAIVAAVFGILYLFRVHQTYFDLFRSCQPKTSILFITIGAIFGLPLLFTGLPLGICTFACREDDWGMPLEETEYIPKPPVHQMRLKRLTKRNQKVLIIAAATVCTAVALVAVLSAIFIPIKRYNNALALLEAGDKPSAAMAFGRLSGYKDAQEQYTALWEEIAVRDTIAAGIWHTASLKSNGTVVATGDNDSQQRNVSGWTDIAAISAGGFHTVGLKSDGTVVTVGDQDCGMSPASFGNDIELPN